MGEDLKTIPLKKAVKNFQGLVKSRNKNNISLVESLKNSRRQDAKKDDINPITLTTANKTGKIVPK